MAKKTAKTKKSPAQAIALPVLNKGEIYKGILVDETGKPVAHVAELTIAATDKKYDDAMAAAKKQGYELPGFKEGALLRASDPRGKNSGWFWLREPYESDPDYAWAQSFDYGHQFCCRKRYEFRARFVRTIPII